MLRGFFSGRADARGRTDAGGRAEARSRDRAAAERLKERVRRLLDLPEDAALTASEIACADPACPGPETVVLIMVPGRKLRAVKFAGALADVDDEAIRAALAPDGAGGGRA